MNIVEALVALTQARFHIRPTWAVALIEVNDGGKTRSQDR